MGGPKEQLKLDSVSLGITFIDLGTHSLESVDYPDFANILAHKLLSEKLGDFGVLICGSGVGVSIAANRFPEIRAVLASNEETAKLAREHNHANVLCLGSRMISFDQAKSILKVFLTTQEDPSDRHLRRIEKLRQKK